MKKIVLLLVLVASITIVFGQKNVRQTASNYLKDGKLDKSMEAINQCVLDPSTAQDSKAWYIRGNVYLAIFTTKEAQFKNLDPDPLPKSLDSYKKALEFDPKKELKDKEFYNEILFKLDMQYRRLFDSAISKYNKKDYKEAMSNFGMSAEVLEPLNLTDTLSLMNAALCAGLANDKAAEKEYYIKLLKGNYKSPAIYSTLSDIYLKEKDSTNAFKYIRMGLKEYPNNQGLFNSEINIYLTYNIVDKAMNNLKISMQKDTANYSIPFALGTLYDNIANDTSKTVAQRDEAYTNAEKSYGRALQIKPDYFEAAFNLGALNLNKASDILVKANNLPPDAQASFEKMKKDADGYLGKAVPYLEKALELDPTDLNTLNALRQIYTRLNQPEKKKAIQDKINAIQKK
jgi:tetratricopeptide (TPR) repeat protein